MSVRTDRLKYNGAGFPRKDEGRALRLLRAPGRWHSDGHRLYLDKRGVITEIASPRVAPNEAVTEREEPAIPEESRESPAEAEAAGNRGGASPFSALAARVAFSSLFSLAALAFAAWGPGGSTDAAAPVLAFGLALVLLRGRPLVFLLPALLLPLVLGAAGLLSGLLHFGPFVVVETLLAAVAVLIAAHRLHLEHLAEELSISRLKESVEELREMTFHDPLTGLYNRRFAFESGRGLVAQHRRYGYELHALMIDIDHFKQINDELGHGRGDEVLKGIAATLRMAIRESDSAARIGGEEFLVILPKAGAEAAQNIANRIRDLVGTTAFEGVDRPVTVSLGVTGLRTGDDFESLVDRADAFLYQSKRSGRNRVSGT